MTTTSEINSNSQYRGGSVLRREVDRGLRVLFVGTCLAVASSYLARVHWILDNLTSFVVQHAVAGAVFSLIFLLLRRPFWASTAIVLCLVSLVRCWPGSAVDASANGQPLQVASINVMSTNRQFDRFIEFVRSRSPDVLLVLEVDAEWAKALEAFDDELPYSVIRARDDNFGLALLSRVPIDDYAVFEMGRTGAPSIVARFTHEGRKLTIVGTHPPPPVGSRFASLRNGQLHAIARFVRDEPNEVVLLGDLNVSPWSPHFGDLLKAGGLADSRVGFGLLASWPSACAPLLTLIDHVLTTDGLVTTERTVGDGIGSDHYPVTARVGFRDDAR